MVILVRNEGPHSTAAARTLAQVEKVVPVAQTVVKVSLSADGMPLAAASDVLSLSTPTLNRAGLLHHLPEFNPQPCPMSTRAHCQRGASVSVCVCVCGHNTRHRKLTPRRVYYSWE